MHSTSFNKQGFLYLPHKQGSCYVLQKTCNKDHETSLLIRNCLYVIIHTSLSYSKQTNISLHIITNDLPLRLSVKHLLCNLNVPYNPALSLHMYGDQILTTSTSHDPLLQSSMCTLHATLFAAILRKNISLCNKIVSTNIYGGTKPLNISIF